MEVAKDIKMDEEKEEEKEKKRPKSFQSKIIIFIILCWVIPIAVIIAFMVVSYRKTVITKMDDIMAAESSNVTGFITERLNDVIKASQRWQWTSKKISFEKPRDLYRDTDDLISELYGRDSRFVNTLFYPGLDELSYVFNSRSGLSIDNFIKDLNDEFEEYIKSNTSNPKIIVMNERVFVIRNLYTVDYYKRFGALIIELNTKWLFAGIRDRSSSDIIICIDDVKNSIEVNNTHKEEQQILERELLIHDFNKDLGYQVVQINNKLYKGVFNQSRERHYQIGVGLVVEKIILFEELNTIYRLLILIILLLIPILVYIIYFLKRQIGEPIVRLVDVSKDITEGEIGKVVDGPRMPNAEFDYLMENFNKMSLQLKYLFDYAYDENLARKDAKILALQAQINPHFLNNTLELMNWQARMSGDVPVSKMIEALSTLLDYRMDRSNKRLIYLSEELRCADAYFYITSMRFGQRIQIVKEIDESLLQAQVPRLLLQPILENAVVHGVERVQNGTIQIQIYHDDVHIYLKVINSGKPLDEKSKEKIHMMLHGDPDQLPKENGYHISLGIRNVNERIKLIYGEEYGLSIESNENGETVSTIILPYGIDDE